MDFYVDVKELPDNVRAALRSVNFNKENIRVVVVESFEPRPPSADGRRGFLAVISLKEGSDKSFDVRWGSFGGANMFTKTIDDIEGSAPIPNDAAFITGLSDAGPGYPAMATLYIGPTNICSNLLPIHSDLTDRQRKILAMFKGYTSAYRKKELAAKKVTEEEIQYLIDKGFLAKKGGGIGITTHGKNNAAKSPY